MNGPPGSDVFQPWGPWHWVALLATGGAALAVSAYLRARAAAPLASPAGRQRSAALAGLAVLLVAAAIVEYVADSALGRIALHDSLPLHLCDLALVTSVLALIGAAHGRSGAGWRWWYELSYYWGLAGTSQALLTPDLLTPAPGFFCARFFVTHGGIIVAVAALTAGLGNRPRAAWLPRVWAATLAAAALVYGANAALGTNYMYLNRPPDRASLFDWFGPHPGALVWLVLVGTAALVVCYAPWWLGDVLSRGRGLRVSAGGQTSAGES